MWMQRDSENQHRSQGSQPSLSVLSCLVFCVKFTFEICFLEVKTSCQKFWRFLKYIGGFEAAFASTVSSETAVGDYSYFMDCGYL